MNYKAQKHLRICTYVFLCLCSPHSRDANKHSSSVAKLIENHFLQNRTMFVFLFLFYPLAGLFFPPPTYIVYIPVEDQFVPRKIIFARRQRTVFPFYENGICSLAETVFPFYFAHKIYEKQFNHGSQTNQMLNYIGRIIFSLESQYSDTQSWHFWFIFLSNIKSLSCILLGFISCN